MSDFEQNIKDFWDTQAKKINKLKPESISNLEEDEALSAKKLLIETKKVLAYLSASKSDNILDLGAGTGQWAIKFAGIVNHVTAVEFSAPMLEIAKKLVSEKYIKNITFHNEKAQKFDTNDSFNIVFISGLLIYLSDVQLNNLLQRICKYLESGGRVVLRDGTGLNGRYEINNKFSEELGSKYTALYRTSEEYISLFEKYGMSILRHEDMFEPGSPLNKRVETRLRIYEFRKEI